MTPAFVPPVVTQASVDSVARISAWQKMSWYFGRISKGRALPAARGAGAHHYIGRPRRSALQILRGFRRAPAENTFV